MNVMLVGYIISDFVLYILAYRVVLHARVNTQKIRWILAICMLTFIHAGIYRIYGERCTTNLTLFSMLVIPILLFDMLPNLEAITLTSSSVFPALMDEKVGIV